MYREHCHDKERSTIVLTVDLVSIQVAFNTVGYSWYVERLIASVIVGIEALGLAVLGGFVLADAAAKNGDRSGIALGIFFLLLAVLAAGVAWLHYRRDDKWSGTRGPIFTLQILLGLSSFTLRELLGWPLAIATMVLAGGALVAVILDTAGRGQAKEG